MRTLDVIGPAEDARWDRFVAGHPFGTVYHLSAWKKALESSFRHIRGTTYALRDAGNAGIQAGLPVYAVHSFLTGKRLVGAPFATLFDALAAERDEMRTFLDELVRRSLEGKYSYVELRTLRSGPLIDDPRFGASTYLKHHYLEIDVPLGQLWDRFHRSCVKQRISRAEKSGLRLEVVGDEDGLRAFYDLLRSTRVRHALPPQPYRFVKALWDEFHPSGKLDILIAQKGTVPAAAVMLLKFRDRASVEFAVHDRGQIDSSPIHYLFWQAIKLSHSQGFRVFDFGGTSPQNLGLLQFKRRWGTREVDLVHYCHPRGVARGLDHREDGWKYRLVQAIVAMRLPEGIRTLIGEFCYRHMG